MMYEQQINDYISQIIIPKHEDVVLFYSHVPKYEFGVEIEFIFKVRFNLIKDELDTLKDNIESDLKECYDKFGLEYNFMIILSTF